jgi:hypothetical protein
MKRMDLATQKFVDSLPPRRKRIPLIPYLDAVGYQHRTGQPTPCQPTLIRPTTFHLISSNIYLVGAPAVDQLINKMVAEKALQMLLKGMAK